jgi:hypothetical protein
VHHRVEAQLVVTRVCLDEDGNRYGLTSQIDAMVDVVNVRVNAMQPRVQRPRIASEPFDNRC